MRISTKIVFNLETLEVIERESYEYSGPVAQLCGASGAENTDSSQAQSLSQLMGANYGERFGQQSQVLKNMQSSLDPILAGGINQQGYNAAETAALNTQAIDSAGSSAKNAEQAINSEFAGRGGGGSSGLVSGPQAAVNASILSAASNNLSNQQLSNTVANYNQGRQNYEGASAGELALAGAYSPNSSAAVNANQNAFSDASQVNQQNQEWEQQLAGLVTGGVGDFVSGTEGGGGAKGGLLALAGG